MIVCKTFCREIVRFTVWICVVLLLIAMAVGTMLLSQPMFWMQLAGVLAAAFGVALMVQLIGVALLRRVLIKRKGWRRN